MCVCKRWGGTYGSDARGVNNIELSGPLPLLLAGLALGDERVRYGGLVRAQGGLRWLARESCLDGVVVLGLEQGAGEQTDERSAGELDGLTKRPSTTHVHHGSVGLPLGEELLCGGKADTLCSRWRVARGWFSKGHSAKARPASFPSGLTWLSSHAVNCSFPSNECCGSDLRQYW